MRHPDTIQRPPDLLPTFIYKKQVTWPLNISVTLTLNPSASCQNSELLESTTGALKSMFFPLISIANDIAVPPFKAMLNRHWPGLILLGLTARQLSEFIVYTSQLWSNSFTNPWWRKSPLSSYICMQCQNTLQTLCTQDTRVITLYRKQWLKYCCYSIVLHNTAATA